MSKQTWTWVVLVAVVLVIIFLVTSKKTDTGNVTTDENNTASTSADNSTSNTTIKTTTTKPAKKTVSYTDPNPAPVSYTNPATHTQSSIYSITYLESGGYLPRTTKVKVGDIVKFTNVGTNQMWTISADYPGHGTNNCGTASEYVIFDQCRIGNSYSFTMGVRGVWTYYNKEAPNNGGTIIVE